jgi:seryl-tRNA synthetase
MENMIQQLDELLNSVGKLRAKYQVLKNINHQNEVQLSTLKVEADQYKQEISKLKKELKEKEEEIQNSMLSVHNKSSVDAVETDSQEKNKQNSLIQLQLDAFIEDIDQCIQIIQSKE